MKAKLLMPNLIFVVTTPESFCKYRPKYSKAKSGWMGWDGYGSTSSKSTAVLLRALSNLKKEANVFPRLTAMSREL